MCQIAQRLGFVLVCGAALFLGVESVVAADVPAPSGDPSVYPIPTGNSNIPVGGAAPWIAPGYAPLVGPTYGGPGYWTPGGYEGRVGSPYYYTPAPEYASGGPAYFAPNGNGFANGYAPQGTPAGVGYGTYGGGNGAYAGGYVGYGFQPYANQGLPPNPYYYHFGPGYYRGAEYGHYRYPWYTYRSPWYYPGHPSYNRDTNLPW